MKKLLLLFLALITSLFIKAQCNPTISPTFDVVGTGTLANQGGFTVGCNQQSLTTICIVNANTSPTPGGALQFCFIPPGGTNCSPNNNQCTVVSTPGTWTVTALDVNNGCQTSQTVTITQNTIAPNISAIVPTQILDCNTPSTTLIGQSTNSAAVLVWLTPGTGSLQGPFITVNTITNTSSSIIGNYTLMIIDGDNGCVSYSVVPMQQNLFLPTPSISVMSQILTCINPTLQLTNVSTTGIPPSSGLPTNQIIQVELWEAPSPQQTVSLISSYVAETSGTYTMTVQDLNNGCSSHTTITIQDDRVINTPAFHLCTNTVEIYPTLVSDASAYSYSWSPNSAIVSANTTARSITVNATGIYSVEVTNTLSGCVTNGAVEVAICTGIAENQTENFTIYPNPSAGQFSVEGNFAAGTQIIISDAVGKQIMKTPLNKGNNSIQIKEESGLYFYQIISQSKQIATGKLLIE
ncbi:MAG: T9SS type A sorting domain-containing protein [Bacteroidetes bacterium]|nr:T9SS type A sorting domain-containing protein [Bacteroidota bacterium]